ncbi:MAG: alkaline phosphatase D family protein [Cyclobacteriaceae bacterium]
MNRNTSHILSYLVALFVLSCNTQQKSQYYLGQGIMVGEVTSSSAILQSRLTSSDTLVNGDIPGIPGIGKFEVAIDPNFGDPIFSPIQLAKAENDFILKWSVSNLDPAQKYHYRLHFGPTENDLQVGTAGTFKTLAGPNDEAATSLAIVTGMNYYHFHFGKYEKSAAYPGEDKHLGYPALEAIKKLRPDYFIGTGDNVYFDHPNEPNFRRAKEADKAPHHGRYNGKEVIDESGMRKKYHEQFSQHRFRQLFREVGTYWLKDDHDYRFNDADPFRDHSISHQLGIKNFKEQLPVASDLNTETYRTHRMSQDLQLWFVEGRDDRSANNKKDGPGKTLWGAEQLEWLKSTLLSSDATFKILVSPTPLVGPDDRYKSDNHTNPNGFKYEGDRFFEWLSDNKSAIGSFHIICGDRHWQYHAIHPSGFEEFSTGALIDNNSRAGRLSGDPDSTDPDGTIEQLYVQGTKEEASGGFLLLNITPNHERAEAKFSFYDEHGNLLYEALRYPK